MVVAHALRAGDVIWIESVARAAGARDALTMHLIRIDHVSLDVHDRPASIAWYEEVLGLRAHACHRVADEPVFLGPAAIIRGRRSVGVSEVGGHRLGDDRLEAARQIALVGGDRLVLRAQAMADGLAGSRDGCRASRSRARAAATGGLTISRRR